jgi:serine/threonine-protein kinase
MLLDDPLIGRKLGEYEVLEVIGEGGMGVVYRGVQPVIKKRVAIKVLKPNIADDVTQVRRLTDEAEAVNSVGHRNIIDIFSLGQLPDGRPYIVMEFLEGEPLDAFLRARGRLTVPEAISLLVAICGPLSAAHRANVIHRDLKPSNIFLCRGADGEQYLKLLDFGLAKKTANLHGTSEQTSRATVTGTPNYMAPEQARGQAISARTDIYALGVMAYELFTGELPFNAPAPMELLMRHVSAPIPSARALVPELPEALDALITQMLAKAPERRVQSVEEVRAALLEQARGLNATTSYETLAPVFAKPSGAPIRPLMTPAHSAPALEATAYPDTVLSQRTVRRRSWPVAAAGLSVLIAALVAALLWTGEPPNAVTPNAVTPNAVTPNAVTPNTATPNAVTPNAATPNTATPNTATPNTATPNTEEPNTATPNTATPNTATPNTAAPNTATPNTATPTKPKTPRGEAPSVDSLRARVERLEAALAKSTPAGEDPDPSAVSLLRKYRVEATMVDSADERARLAKNLDTFERTFLRR